MARRLRLGVLEVRPGHVRMLIWCRGCYADTVGKNAKKIEEHIRNQLKEDRMAVRLPIDFDGQPVNDAGVGPSRGRVQRQLVAEGLSARKSKTTGLFGG